MHAHGHSHAHGHAHAHGQHSHAHHPSHPSTPTSPRAQKLEKTRQPEEPGLAPSKHSLDLVKKILALTPKDRPTVGQILEDLRALERVRGGGVSEGGLRELPTKESSRGIARLEASGARAVGHVEAALRRLRLDRERFEGVEVETHASGSAHAPLLQIRLQTGDTEKRGRAKAFLLDAVQEAHDEELDDFFNSRDGSVLGGEVHQWEKNNRDRTITTAAAR